MKELPLIALAGNPNAGKSTLFNALTGQNIQTGNFPGTTVSRKSGVCDLGGETVELLDLPGMYSMDAATPEEQVASDFLQGIDPKLKKPDALIMLLDATNLDRNLFLLSQVVECDLPVVCALNMLDLAETEGIHVDAERLSARLGCPVVPIVARSGTGLDALRDAVRGFFEFGLESYPRPHKPSEDVKCGVGCQGCPFHGRFTWSETIASEVVTSRHVMRNQTTEKLDGIFTHPVGGVLSFFAIIGIVFFLIFSFASIPMDLIDLLFGSLGSWIEGVMPETDFRSFLVDGIISGVGGIVIFLPQICILFFFLALLEDTGYLARAAFVMDRLMRRVGLPGTAFVPLLSGHACAIPAIMATRVISDPRDRLATILVVPLTSCSARLPVYTMIVALLFPDNPGKAALLFAGAYILGITAALLMAFVLKKTILPGESKPLILELPTYKVPNVGSALRHTREKALVFLKQAGTTILVISMVLWVLATYPKSDPPAIAAELQQQAVEQPEAAEALLLQADVLTQQHSLSRSFAGRLGHVIEPVVKPLGFDWQIGIGIISSFAAREVIVSTLSVVYGMGEDTTADDPSLLNTMRGATRSDGSPIFTTATCLSLLVFYVLAMQCLPTQAVTRAETGSWKWAAFQLAYMTALAYGASLITFQALRALGVG
jgi:ferrous iron transport protein B